MIVKSLKWRPMVIYISLGLILIWLIIISWLLYKTRSHYYNLISGSKKEKLDSILEYLLANDKIFSSEIEKLTKAVKESIEQSKISVQKLGMVRFNPFEKRVGNRVLLSHFSISTIAVW